MDIPIARRNLIIILFVFLLKARIALRMGLGVSEGPDDADITYATAGYICQRYLGQKSRPVIDFTHIVIDEVHERTIENDTLLLLARSLLLVNPQIKIILMSATMTSRSDDHADEMKSLSNADDNSFNLASPSLSTEEVSINRQSTVSDYVILKKYFSNYLQSVAFNFGHPSSVSSCEHHVGTGSNSLVSQSECAGLGDMIPLWGKHY